MSNRPAQSGDVATKGIVRPATGIRTIRTISHWTIRRGSQAWPAKALKVSGGDLAAAGIMSDDVTLEIRAGEIIIRSLPNDS